MTFIDPVQATLWNIVRIGENAGNQHFLLFPQCFLSQDKFEFLSRIYFVDCKFFQYGPV